MSPVVPLFGSNRARVWLAGEIDAPPHEAKIGDLWWPETDVHCYVLTRAGWVVDRETAAVMLESLSSPAGA